MSEKFFVLLITNAIVNQYLLVVILDQHASHSPGTEIIFICRVKFVPDYFRHYAKHGAAVKLEMAGINCIDFHIYLL